MHADKLLTRLYYQSDASTPCDCGYCKNFYAKIKDTHPSVCAYLDSLGVDVLRPLELSALEPDRLGNLEYYVCQYVVLGSCENVFHHKIGDVTFALSLSHPSTGVEQPHFVLNFYPIHLPF